jgi:hypothetical protein
MFDPGTEELDAAWIEKLETNQFPAETDDPTVFGFVFTPVPR